MKIIHCADVHLGTKFASKFPADIAKQRQSELRTCFSEMIDFARQNGVQVILLSGDVFDSDKPTIKDKEFFYNAVRNNPEIDFLYLNGNHDKEGSYLQTDIPNLKTFSKTGFTSYSYGNIVISGIEMDAANAKSFYSMLELDRSKLNIVMLHGDVSDSRGMDKVRVADLRNQGIDYLALGHIHSFATGTIDDRGTWAFSGCLAGRGFDECGEKGFVLLDVTDRITAQFCCSSARTIHKLPFDVTGCADLYTIQQKLKQQTDALPSSDILRVELSGDLESDIDLSENDVISALSRFYFVNVKNNTSVRIDPSAYAADTSLIGEFVRGVSANADYDAYRKNKLIALGLKLLSGREVE